MDYASAVMRKGISCDAKAISTRYKYEMNTAADEKAKETADFLARMGKRVSVANIVDYFIDRGTTGTWTTRACSSRITRSGARAETHEVAFCGFNCARSFATSASAAWRLS
jgi:hypothetical protein